MNEGPTGQTLSAIADKHYAEGDYTRKAISYFRAYERILEDRRESPLRILELGVSSGASLLMWRDYLPRATIVGIDIADKPACLADERRVHFIQASQDDPAALDLAAQIAGGGFDLIIDDASHIGFLTKRSFNYLFPRWLVAGGCYVIEDIGTGFLADYPDGAPYIAPSWEDAVDGTAVFKSHQHGMVGVAKQLIDHLMQDMITGIPTYLPIGRLCFETNVVFVEKSRQSGAPVPGPLPMGPAVPVADAVTERLDEIAGQLRVTAEELARQNKRVAELEQVVTERLDEMAGQLRATAEGSAGQNKRLADLEQVVGRVLKALAPLRPIWRLVTGRPRSRDPG